MWVCVLVLVAVAHAQVAVDAPAGRVQGRGEGYYTTFLGIPYARVDRDNTFGPSTPYPLISEPFEAFNGSIKCSQARFPDGVLQCLRLNIYVPRRPGNEKLPVFVWFHGGGFVFGYGGYYGGKFLVQQNIIVITVNYRLGPYGFLCLDHPDVPGNQGLKDQVQALRWIRDNIHAFGGDPAKVTIAGESSGGGAVDVHLYSDYDKYYDKAIIQSGAAEVEGFFVKPDYNAAIKLAKLLNYTANNSSEALKVLANVDPSELVKIFDDSGMSLGVCKEKKFKNVQNFITDAPFHLNNPKNIKDTPVLIGYNSKEMFSAFADKPEEYFDSITDIFFDKLNGTFKLGNRELSQLADIVKKFYLGSKSVKKENVLPIIDFMSDYVGAFAVENSVNRLADQGAHVYKYIFSYTGNSPFKNVTGVGASHTKELQYLFEFEGEDLVEPEHIMMRDRMTTLWANFVNNPTPEPSALMPVIWSEVPRDSRPYLDIGLHLAMKQDVHQHRLAFWDLLWDTYRTHSKIIS